MPTDPFSILTKQGPYTGMYPGSDPYSKPEMVKEGIPSAQQEALQNPVDPIKAALLGVSGGGIIEPAFNPITQQFVQRIARGLFAYLTSALGQQFVSGDQAPPKGKSNAGQSR